VDLHVVPNRFFGGHITVTGLITGHDLIDALENQELGDALLLPDSMLLDERDRFLDDMTLETVATCCKPAW
jgi:NifB/MoaA-like Fe-S oxidoreductase